MEMNFFSFSFNPYSFTINTGDGEVRVVAQTVGLSAAGLFEMTIVGVNGEFLPTPRSHHYFILVSQNDCRTASVWDAALWVMSGGMIVPNLNGTPLDGHPIVSVETGLDMLMHDGHMTAVKAAVEKLVPSMRFDGEYPFEHVATLYEITPDDPLYNKGIIEVEIVSTHDPVLSIDNKMTVKVTVPYLQRIIRSEGRRHILNEAPPSSLEFRSTYSWDWKAPQDPFIVMAAESAESTESTDLDSLTAEVEKLRADIAIERKEVSDLRELISNDLRDIISNWLEEVGLFPRDEISHTPGSEWTVTGTVTLTLPVATTVIAASRLDAIYLGLKEFSDMAQRFLGRFEPSELSGTPDYDYSFEEAECVGENESDVEHDVE